MDRIRIFVQRGDADGVYQDCEIDLTDEVKRLLCDMGAADRTYAAISLSFLCPCEPLAYESTFIMGDTKESIDFKFQKIAPLSK